MKRTKNMIYKETVESHELVLYATNDSRLHNSIVLPIIANLKRKYKKKVVMTATALLMHGITWQIVQVIFIIKISDTVSMYRNAIQPPLILKAFILKM